MGRAGRGGGWNRLEYQTYKVMINTVITKAEHSRTTLDHWSKGNPSDDPI